MRNSVRRASALIYYIASFFAFYLLVWVRHEVGDTNLPPLHSLARLVANLLLANIIFSYFFLIRQIDNKPFSDRVWWVLAASALVLCAIPPLFGGDLMEYLIRGRIFGLYHLNPYVHFPREFPQDILFPYSIWQNHADAYGPLFLGIKVLPVILFPNSIFGMIWAQKTIFLIFMALGTYWLLKIAELSKADQGYRHAILFVLNPLLVLRSLVDGNNDIVMVCFSIGAVTYLLQKKYTACFLLWSSAFLVKYAAVIFLPILIAIAIREKWDGGRSFPWRFVSKQISVNVIYMAAFFFPVWSGPNVFSTVFQISRQFYTNTVPYAFFQAAQFLKLPMSEVLVSRIFLAAFLIFYVSILRGCWRRQYEDRRWLFRSLFLLHLACYFVITSPLMSHYLLWGLPWLTLCGWPGQGLAIFLYTATGLFSYWKRINYLALASLFIYIAWFLVLFKGRLSHLPFMRKSL